MDYKLWAEEYLSESENLLNTINREKINLSNAKNQDDRQCINRRIQILRSMYYESKLTASLLYERAADYRAENKQFSPCCEERADGNKDIGDCVA